MATEERKQIPAFSQQALLDLVASQSEATERKAQYWRMSVYYLSIVQWTSSME